MEPPEILECKKSEVIRVTIKRGELMVEIVKAYIKDGWDFLNHYDGETPEHGQVTYLRFSREA